MPTKKRRKKPVLETPEQRAASEKKFTEWLKKEAAESEWDPKAADVPSEDDAEADNE